MPQSKRRGALSRRMFLKSSARAAGLFVATAATGALAQRKINEPEEKPAVEHEMIEIPAGEFVMGTSEEEIDALCEEYGIAPSWLITEAPKRKVHLDAFRIDKYPVTNAQYAEFVRATGPQPPQSWRGKTYPSELANHPVTTIRHNQALDYAQWAGKRLPTEEEWEKAARGTQGLIYPWGTEWEPARCNFNPKPEESWGPGTSPVDAYPNGAGPYGVIDMAGNVMEWTATKWGNSHVVKGGAWILTQPYNMRCAARSYTRPPVNATAYVGFRCAK